MTTTDNEPPICLDIEARAVLSTSAKPRSEVGFNEAVLAEFTSSEHARGIAVGKEELSDDRPSLTAGTEAALGM